DLRARASAARRHVQRVWWLPGERLYGDVRASHEELAELVSQFEPLAPSSASHRASIELLRQVLVTQTEGEPTTERRPWLFGHMVQALAADAGLPTSEQAAQLLDRLQTSEWTKQYGIVLNRFNASGVMTLPTGAMAVGEARYGRIDRALEYVQRIASTFGQAMPGVISEYSPDGGCFWQLWSSYGIVWPIVHYLFGVRPKIGQRQVLCAPHLPSTWPSAQLRGIPLGQDEVNVSVEALPNGL